MEPVATPGLRPTVVKRSCVVMTVGSATYMRITPDRMSHVWVAKGEYGWWEMTPEEQVEVEAVYHGWREREIIIEDGIGESNGNRR